MKENAEELQGIGKFVQGLTRSQGVRIPLQFTPHTAHSHQSTFIPYQTPTGTDPARHRAPFYE